MFRLPVHNPNRIDRDLTRGLLSAAPRGQERQSRPIRSSIFVRTWRVRASPICISSHESRDCRVHQLRTKKDLQTFVNAKLHSLWPPTTHGHKTYELLFVSYPSEGDADCSPLVSSPLDPWSELTATRDSRRAQRKSAKYDETARGAACYEVRIYEQRWESGTDRMASWELVTTIELPEPQHVIREATCGENSTRQK